MIVKHGSNSRASNAELVFRNGDFAYKLNTEWAKWPDHLVGVPVAGGCCDKDDNIWVTTRWNDHPVLMLDKDGNFVKDIGKGLFSNLHGIFVTPAGTLLCADASTHHVVREITVDGELVRDFGNFDVPGDSGFDPDIWMNLKRRGVLPCDAPYDVDLEFYEGLKTIVRAGEPFNKPTRMIMASTGEYFACDGYGNAAVHKFDKDGKYVKTWGGPGYDVGQYRLPHGIWADKLDRIWVADRENNRVHVYDTDGNQIGMVDELNLRPAEVWSDENYVYIGEVDGGVSILDMDMNVICQIGYYYSPLMAHGLCGDSKSNLYIQALHLSKTNNLLRLERI